MIAQEYIAGYAKLPETDRTMLENFFTTRMKAEMDVVRMTVTRTIIRSGDRILRDAGDWIAASAGYLFSAPEALPRMTALQAESDKIGPWIAPPLSLLASAVGVVNAAAKAGLIIEDNPTLWSPQDMFKFMGEVDNYLRHEKRGERPKICSDDGYAPDHFGMSWVWGEAPTGNPLNRPRFVMAVPLTLGVLPLLDELEPLKKDKGDRGETFLVTLKDYLSES